MRFVAVIALATACTSKPAPHASQTFQVEIRGMQFVPAALRVHTGDLVVFTNKDLVPHTATSAGFFDSGPLQPGQVWTLAITERLDYQYVCTMHPTMHGELNAL
jgi:plastocyanin